MFLYFNFLFVAHCLIRDTNKHIISSKYTHAIERTLMAFEEYLGSIKQTKHVDVMRSIEGRYR